MAQGIFEEIEYPIIQDNKFVMDYEIINAANIAAEASISALSQLTPETNEDVQMELCCIACKKSNLLPIVKEYCDKGFDKMVGPVNPNNSEIVKTGLVRCIINDICTMRTNFGLCSAETAQGLALFVTFCQRHWLCATFRLFRPVLQKFVVISMMIAHKANSDRPFANKWWAQSFGMNIEELNEFEQTLLVIMDYQVIARNRQYDGIMEAMCGYEFGKSTRLGKYLDDTRGWIREPKR
ncbi:MAG: hypothetical protein EZS28_021656 [Streblomastix strix]|uniref:Uncharacterized protein n=1 Tax=Streblomastix strix TaxID=222440 RepID=A0A5J4VJR1_9EUKA|nr:MAG: hypothetical protein EZS28_021656 [Streblomastix strix]